MYNQSLFHIESSKCRILATKKSKNEVKSDANVIYIYNLPIMNAFTVCPFGKATA